VAFVSVPLAGVPRLGAVNVTPDGKDKVQVPVVVMVQVPAAVI
jgi:hypothetical protein